MRLAELGLDEALVYGAAREAAFALQIERVTVDSREAGPGALFFAVKGVERHGADFAPQALAAGAAAVVASPEGVERLRAHLEAAGVPRWPAPILVVHSPRRALARAAARFYPRQPSDLVAVTGTNGKTSVARFVAQIWARAGRPTAAFGTTGVVAENLPGGPIDEPLSHTTPEPITLHALLDRLAGLGVEAAAMEASSHALAQQRLLGARLRAAGFTNLTRDHLDYHPSASDYAAAKLSLFSALLPEDGVAVYNADAAIAESLRDVTAARGLRRIEVGRAAAGAGALRILEQKPSEGGQRLTVTRDGARFELEIPLVGLFQGDNALMAAGLAIACGGDAAESLGALEHLVGAPGRMELVARRGNGAGVFVDYAHTPDAVATALTAIKPHASGRIGVVVGAGGDRDPGKRAPMGAAAAAADFIIVTDDNPRSEDPATIRAAVWAGLGAAEARAQEIGDRAEAILTAVDALQPGDVVVIAGKGHERGQIVKGDVLPFDDREQARAAALALDGEAAQLFGA